MLTSLCACLDGQRAAKDRAARAVAEATAEGEAVGEEVPAAVRVCGAGVPVC